MLRLQQQYYTIAKQIPEQIECIKRRYHSMQIYISTIIDELLPNIFVSLSPNVFDIQSLQEWIQRVNGILEQYHDIRRTITRHC